MTINDQLERMVRNNFRVGRVQRQQQQQQQPPTPFISTPGWFTAFTLCTWVVIGSTVHPTYSELPTFNDTAYCQARRNASLTFSNHSNPLSPDIDSSTSPASSTLFSRKHDDHDIQEFVKKYSEEMSNWKNTSSEESLAQEKGLEVAVEKVERLENKKVPTQVPRITFKVTCKGAISPFCGPE